jgi:hypothetical protein
MATTIIHNGTTLGEIQTVLDNANVNEITLRYITASNKWCAEILYAPTCLHSPNERNSALRLTPGEAIAAVVNIASSHVEARRLIDSERAALRAAKLGDGVDAQAHASFNSTAGSQ